MYEIFIGTIISKKDVTGKGMLTVCPKKKDVKNKDNWRSVKYVSFYGGGEHAGAGFVPETNTDILYARAKNDTGVHYYYLGSVWDKEVDLVQGPAAVRQDKDHNLGGEKFVALSPHDAEDGADNEQSMSYGITTPLGHHMLMRDNRTDKEDNKGAIFGSARGHGLTLDDSTRTQKVNLHSKDQGATLKLTDFESENDTIGPEGAELHAIGNNIIESSEGELTLRVTDGRNINISNFSTGSHKSVPGAFAPPGMFGSETGNVIIESDTGNIVIRNHGNGVFIDCIGGQSFAGGTGASFQVRSNNKIHLYSDNGIDLKSAGDINISGRTVRIQSNISEGGTVELNPFTDSTLLDALIGIRKTNVEIDYEYFFGVFPFFMDDIWLMNYTSGPNLDGRL